MKAVKAEAPLFRDPIYDAPTDPVVVWNRHTREWWMYYTQRRSGRNSIGVAHIHGTGIGVASSKDGSRWLYRGTLPNLDFEIGTNTFWAPEIISAGGKYHMYVSYITGVPTDWNWERHIVHYTSGDMWNWTFQSILPLSSDRVIDACVYPFEDGYKMWYKDEMHDSHTYTAYSRDLYDWTAGEAEITDVPHEGPNVFEFGGKKWMITDEWHGLGVYRSEDLSKWEKTGVILYEGGSRPGDGVMANHADVLVCGENAYIFYFTHPLFSNEDRRKSGFVEGEAESRTCIQVAKLHTDGNTILCDRDEDFTLELDPKKIAW